MRSTENRPEARALHRAGTYGHRDRRRPIDPFVEEWLPAPTNPAVEAQAARLACGIVGDLEEFTALSGSHSSQTRKRPLSVHTTSEGQGHLSSRRSR